MKKLFVILVFFSFNTYLIFAQNKNEFSKLLYEISIENSIDIITSNEAKKIISHTEKSLPILADLFMDTTKTNIKSDCLKRFLTRGEIAIIIADRIERMPYFKLTGMQNCTLEFCKNNPNVIEYYLNFVEKDKAKSFSEKYKIWLRSAERKS